MADTPAPDWHVQYRQHDVVHVAWYTTPEQAIEAACTFLDESYDVFSIGLGSLDDSIAKDQIIRIYDIWSRAKPRRLAPFLKTSVY